MRHQQRIVLDQPLTASARAADALVVPRKSVRRMLQLPQPDVDSVRAIPVALATRVWPL